MVRVLRKLFVLPFGLLIVIFTLALSPLSEKTSINTTVGPKLRGIVLEPIAAFTYATAGAVGTAVILAHDIYPLEKLLNNHFSCEKKITSPCSL